LKFGYVLSCVSACGLPPLAYVIYSFHKNKQQESENQREAVVQALDIWIAKSVAWYLVVCVAFMVIMLDQESNQLLSLIITGIVTFILLFWWRTTFADSLDRIESYKLELSLAERAVKYDARRARLDDSKNDRV
jgi:L-asparagine transporter-like permease